MTKHGPLHTLIDAHNILHQDPEFARSMHDPEAVRWQLEDLLAGQLHMHIFYDGGPDGEQRSHHRQGLHIDYAGTDEADNRIIKWLQQHPNTRTIVITDDNELRSRARALGAMCGDARGFLSQFRNKNHHTDSDRGPLSPAQVDEWMKIFGITETKIDKKDP